MQFEKKIEDFYENVYDDGYGYLTIGYGHLIKPGESFTTISKSQALRLLSQDLYEAEQRVNNYSQKLCVSWTQNEFDALVSLSFNSGYNVHHVMDALTAGENPYTAFSKIINVRGQRVLGLYRRRMDEADIFVEGIYHRTYRDW